MSRVTCKHCRKQVYLPHHCPVVDRRVDYSNGDDFMAIVTNEIIAESILDSTPDISLSDASGSGGDFGGGGSEGSW